MSDTPSVPPASASAVRAAVTAAAGQRQRRESSSRLWRVAPASAAIGLVAAAAARLGGGPMALALGAVGAVVLGLAAYVFVQRRERAVSDELAARIDAEGEYAGELRSAFWFATQEVRTNDAWTQFHVDRAAARLGHADWRQLYPAARASRARLTTAALLAAAITLAVATPERAGVRAGEARDLGVGAEQPVASSFRLEMLPPDLLKQIEELLAQAENGSLSARSQARAIELSAMFTALASDLDTEKLMELARAMDPTERGSVQEAANTLAELADRALKAANVEDMPADVRQALQDLGTQLARTAEAEQRAAADASQLASTAAKGAQATTASAEGPPSLDQSAIQMATDGDAAAGAGLMMLAPQLASRGNPSSGFGGSGKSGPLPIGAPMNAAELAEALRHELVEASADTAGENVLSETRRKTERGQATVGFTLSAPRTSDRTRASAPPPVPEDRRGAVRTYFNRKQ